MGYSDEENGNSYNNFSEPDFEDPNQFIPNYDDEYNGHIHDDFEDYSDSYKDVSNDQNSSFDACEDYNDYYDFDSQSDDSDDTKDEYMYGFLFGPLSPPPLDPHLVSGSMLKTMIMIGGSTTFMTLKTTMTMLIIQKAV